MYGETREGMVTVQKEDGFRMLTFNAQRMSSTSPYTLGHLVCFPMVTVHEEDGILRLWEGTHSSKDWNSRDFSEIF